MHSTKRERGREVRGREREVTVIVKVGEVKVTDQ